MLFRPLLSVKEMNSASQSQSIKQVNTFSVSVY